MEDPQALIKPLNNDFESAFRLLREKVKDRPVVPLEAEGTSMSPLIKNGIEVLVRLTPPDKLEAGDVIAYKRGGRLIMHRCIKKAAAQDCSWGFVTKGDNSLFFDPGQVLPEDILGKAVLIKGYKRSLDLENSFWRINNNIMRRLSSFETEARKFVFYHGRILKPEARPLLRQLVEAFLHLPLVTYSYLALLLAGAAAPRTQR